MIAYGIATSFQVLSNLSNTSELKLEAAEGAEEEGAVGKEEAAAALKEQERFAGLFDGGRLPPKKLSVNYLMEVGTALQGSVCISGTVVCFPRVVNGVF